MFRKYSIIALLNLPLLANCGGAAAPAPRDSLLAEEVPTVVTESKSGDFQVDAATELAWSTRVSVELHYSETRAYCASLGKGWRLPTIGELHTIMTGQPKAMRMKPEWSKGLPSNGVLFSSEEIPRIDDQKQPLLVRISSGESFAGPGQDGYVRCVHGPISRQSKPFPMPPEPLLTERWWEHDSACPSGSVARGTVGRLVACKSDDGNTNGRSSSWTQNERIDAEYRNETLNGTAVKWRADGLKISEANYRDGELHGRSTYWHANGERASESDYANGKLDGKSVKWRSDGLKEAEMGYRGGELHGRTTYWYESGEKASESTFANGKLNGRVLKWRADGIEEADMSYRHGELHGRTTYWYESGEKSSEATYANGKLSGKSVKWRPDGIKESEMNYRNGDLHGTSTTWFANGETSSVATFANGKPHGKTVKWRADGLKQSETTYRNGELDGPSTSYFANGEKLSETNFSNGLMHGVHQRWDDQGNLLERTQYVKARIVDQLHYDRGTLRNGSVETKHPNGVVSYIGVFKDGHAQGKHYGYHPNGNQQFERNYNAKGIPSGRSVDWHSTGKAREASRFVRGALHGERTFFDEDGKPVSRLFYDEGIPVTK